MRRRDVLLIFARYPAPGAVKTRLARTIGAEAAAALYGAFLADLARRFGRGRMAVRWLVAPPDPGLAALLGLRRASCREQSGEDLGARMHEAFRSMRKAGWRRVAIIGSDSPQIPLATVERAFALLDGADLVLGPAEDGGYYLIAMREPHDVFAGIEWGSRSVLRATRARALRLGLRVAELEPSFDVDRKADLERLRKLLQTPGGRAAMPATARLLDSLRTRPPRPARRRGTPCR
ncbi:MAG TPA: TIGR04282 family arsenosugar biosynthesis glycosyltransferase [Candidatus Bathyarchaeia archaeon]|nr:TIGR04282 family arsenosugar biosynthesis glycosyltransferase [Candidatus Bathyarchaeia archaeon]